MNGYALNTITIAYNIMFYFCKYRSYFCSDHRDNLKSHRVDNALIEWIWTAEYYLKCDLCNHRVQPYPLYIYILGDTVLRLGE